MKEFIVRTSSAAVMIALVYSAVRFLPTPFFFSFLFLLASAAVYEFHKMQDAAPWQYLLSWSAGLALAFSLWRGTPALPQVLFLALLVNGVAMVLWVRRPERLPRFPAVFGQQMLALIYLYFPLTYLFLLREQRHGLLFFLIYSVAIGDSGAYFFGKAFGRHKIYPIASPKKSLEGFIAALVSAAVFAVGGYYLFGLTDYSLVFIMLSGVLLALLSQLADPLESLFKRFAGVKDSGQIIPGHGGILDRIDSYLLCAPAFYFWLQWFS